jgi:hypothetical protein
MQNSWCRSVILSKLISPNIFLLFLHPKSKTQAMSIFGIVLFLLIFGMAFWLLLFLLGFIVPFWITLGIFEKMRPKRIFEEAEEH